MNVIVFFTDQQRYDAMGVHGNPDGLTPNFDRIALEGTFNQYAFTPQPVCGPARACLQTGKYATALGNYRNSIPLPKTHKTMAHYFNRAGYDTAYIGKWHLGTTRLAVPEEERGGYQYWLGAGALEASSRPYDTVVYDNDSFTAPSSMKSLMNPYTPPDLAALRGTAHQHLPGYYGMVKRLDECLGRIQDALKSLQLEEETILLFTTDHGCHFKTRNAEYKRSCHESSIRIPMAFTGGPFTGGGTLRELVSLVDIAPTLLDACKIALPGDMQGKSFLPIIRRQPCEWRDAVFTQISEAEVGRTIRTHRWKYAVTAPEKDPVADSGSECYVESALYDLAEDPYELENLIGMPSHRALCDILKEKLLRQMELAGEQRAEIVHAPKQECGQRKVFPGEELR